MLELIQKSNMDRIGLIPLQGVAVGEHHVKAGSVRIVDHIALDAFRTASPKLDDGINFGQFAQNGLLLCFDVFGRSIRFEIKENRMQNWHVRSWFVRNDRIYIDNIAITNRRKR